VGRIDWIITVIDGREKRWPQVEMLRKVGARAETIVKYKRARRQLSPAGLRRKLRDQEN
jgi:hypothetical protein